MLSYIHVPFCENKCKYCRFARVGILKEVSIDKYVKHLVDDIVNFKRPIKGASVLDSVYFGGGTPSILKKEKIKLIIDALDKRFGLSKDAEITLETDPKNITLKKINSREELGINRISIGIQSLNDKAIKAIGRNSGKKAILNGLDLLKNSKIKNVSVDFIIGLPYVKAGETLDDIKYVLKNFSYIKHVSIYMLEDYYSLDPEEKDFQKITYPKEWIDLGIKEEEYLKEYLEIKEYLESKGFKRYEISNFAIPGYECKHNKGYWGHKEYVGFGLGSHSFVGGFRYAYKSNFISYYNKELEYEEFLTQDDMFVEKIMFGIRTSGLSKKLYKRLNQKKISELIKSGFLKMENKNLVLGDIGVTLVDRIILEII